MLPKSSIIMSKILIQNLSYVIVKQEQCNKVGPDPGKAIDAHFKGPKHAIEVTPNPDVDQPAKILEFCGRNPIHLPVLRNMFVDCSITNRRKWAFS